MAENKKFTKLINSDGTKQAVALDKVSFDAQTKKLTLYSSVDNSIKEETTIPASEVDTTLSKSGLAADAKATGDAVKDVVKVGGTASGFTGIIVGTGEEEIELVEQKDFDAEIAKLNAKVGTPLVANAASAMVDTTKIYVYTGNENGYVNGNWYFYNGTNWESGGVYNAVAVQTDKTLTQENKAADGKAVGDELGSLKSDLSDVRDTIFNEQSVGVYSTSSNYKLTDSGNPYSDSTYNIYKYKIVSGKLYKINTTHKWQFSTTEGISQSVRVGLTHTGSAVIVAPATSAYLIVSELKTETQSVYELADIPLNLIEVTIDKNANCGIAVERNNDGTFTANGTAKQDVRIYLRGDLRTAVNIPKGTYKFSCCPSTASAEKYFVSTEYYYFLNGTRTYIAAGVDYGSGATVNLTHDAELMLFMLTVKSGQTLNDVVFKPMLTNKLDATYSDYVGYTGELKNCTLKTINEQFADTSERIFRLKGKVKSSVYWENGTKPPYWILHLDCGNKFFSVASVKNIIDLISANGFNQLNLYFSAYRGFRFALDDMNFTDSDGVTYNLTPCLGGLEASTSWYNQDDMDAIIDYAKANGIEIVPNFDMPGHMEWILNQFPQFKFQSYGTLDITNPTAVKFSLAILEKYCKYFASKGCTFWNIGFDELEPSGFALFYGNGEFNTVTNLVNKYIEIVKSYGFTPRIWNEVVHYHNDYNYFVSKDAEVLVWDCTSANLARPNTLLDMGYKIINMGAWLYWVLDTNVKPDVLTFSKANLLINYDGFTNNYNRPVYGASMSIWCADVETIYPNDGGAYIVSEITPYIQAFGEAITRAGFESYQGS